MNKWLVEIPNWHPIRTNELIGVHWTSTYKRKKTQHYLVALECWKAGVPIADQTRDGHPIKIKRRVTLTIRLALGQRGGDPDAYWKVLLDSLVKCHALVDDRKEWVELAPVQYERSKKGPATFILLEDLN